ncbi:MAG: hypothetical protein GF334_00185, partial [Candidatus Altiarchaeales archaeon]|nr:hypothetical protein [Candidatus Altiarchaeales archaeon]
MMAKDRKKRQLNRDLKVLGGVGVLKSDKNTHEAYHQHQAKHALKLFSESIRKQVDSQGLESLSDAKLEEIHNLAENVEYLIWGSSDEDRPINHWETPVAWSSDRELFQHGLPTLTHGYAVLKDGKSFLKVPKNAMVWGVTLWRLASHYRFTSVCPSSKKRDYPLAYHTLGRVIHLLGGDMVIPAHVHADTHVPSKFAKKTRNMVDIDPFEECVSYRAEVYSQIKPFDLEEAVYEPRWSIA